jgi:CRISPR-associated protein Cmr1
VRPAPTHGPAETGRRSIGIVDDRKYRFLTYGFGGGVKVRAHEKFADERTPVRGAAVRGQLRFWWRACNPGRCTTVSALREREAEIWGSTEQSSQVVIEVTKQPEAPKAVQIFEYNHKGRLVARDGMRVLAYGAFPLQPERDLQHRQAHPGVLFDYGESSFTLRLAYPATIQEDVQAALWAWETFGGLGARTRRGFGAIHRISSAPSSPPIAEALERYGGHPKIAGVPSLAGARFVASGKTTKEARWAWEEGLGLLQRLRQGIGAGRNQGAKGPGRSRWPEADEIRALTGKSAPKHSKPLVPVNRFPRGQFGMPIVFHFSPGSRDEPESQGDPALKPLHLKPIGFERFASPLILRPIAEGERFKAAALVLSSDLPAAEFVAGKSSTPVRCDLDPTLAAAIEAMKNAQGKVFTDPLELFLSELA